MNAYAMFAADEALRITNNRLAELRLESQKQRLASADGSRRPLFRAVASLASTLRATFPTVDDRPAVLPKLADYPYRS
jgi:hypothetical protein